MPADDAERNAKQARDATLLDHLDVSTRPGARDAGRRRRRTTRRGRRRRRTATRSARRGTGAVRRGDARRRAGRPRGVAVPRLPAARRRRRASPSPVTDSPKPPPERISLTFAALNRSRRGVVRGLRRGQGRGGRAGARPTGRDAGRRARSIPAVRACTASDADRRGSLDEDSRPRELGSEDDLAALAAGPQGLDRLVEDVLGLLVGAALLHVGEVRLVRLDLRRRRRVVGVQAGRQAAARAVPDRGSAPRRRR